MTRFLLVLCISVHASANIDFWSYTYCPLPVSKWLPVVNRHSRSTPLRRKRSYWQTLISKVSLHYHASDTDYRLRVSLLVAHRTRQFESWFADALENFRIHQEGLISRVPRLVRGITMRDFAKYNGDVQECLRGIQRERLGGDAAIIDKTTRKRKWVESQETEIKASEEAESSKAAKAGEWIKVMFICMRAHMQFHSPYDCGYPQEEERAFLCTGNCWSLATTSHKNSIYCMLTPSRHLHLSLTDA